MIAYRILLEEPPTRSLEYAVSDYSGNPIELWRYCIQNPAIKGRSLGNVSWVGVEKLIKLFIRGSHKENVPHVRLYLGPRIYAGDSVAAICQHVQRY